MPTFSSDAAVITVRLVSAGIYYAPHLDTVGEYKAFIDDLPQNDAPEIFGMHENANIAFQTQETISIINTILEVQPRQSPGAVGNSNDDIVMELCDNILGQLSQPLDIEDASQDIFQVSHLLTDGPVVESDDEDWTWSLLAGPTVTTDDKG